MCRPSRWWLGLAPLAALFLVALFMKTPNVEADVAANARAALDQQGVIEPNVSVAGRDVKLSGLLMSAGDKAREAALAATGVRKVDDGLKPLPVQKPYAVSFARTSDGVTVTGFSPDPSARADLVKAAGALGRVNDQTTYAAGAPQGFAAMVSTALSALAPLSNGTASLTDGALSVAGRAPDLSSYEKAQFAASSKTPGMTLAKFDVNAPQVSPYVFSARRDGAALKLTGFAPDAAARGRLLDAARRTAAQVEDGLRVAGGAPQGFEGMAKAALGALASLTKGEFDLTGPSLSISGEAADQTGYDAARAALAGKPAEMTLAKAQIAPPAMHPYPFAVAKQGARLVLTGATPDEATHGRIVAAAKATGALVDDKLLVARGAGPDFEAQALAALASVVPLGEGEASLSDAAAKLMGEAATSAARDKAIAALKAPGMTVANVDVATADGAALDARRDGRALILSGQIPDAQTRDMLLAAARAISPDVTDRMSVARGGAPGFGAVAKAGVDALAHVVKGEARATGEALSVSGWLAPGETASGATRVAAAQAPKGVNATFDWRYPPAQPFVFEAKKTSGGALALSGHAPNEASLAALDGAARAFGGHVTGSATLASGLSQKINFDRLVELGFSFLKRVDSGWMRVADDGLSFGGQASEADAAAIRAALEKSGVALGKIDLVSPPPPPPIAPPPPAPEPAPTAVVAASPPAAPAPAPAKPVDPVVAACHAQILEKLAEETIEFSTGSARIAPKSTALIGRLATVIKNCPQADLEIAGHTDNVGDPERNLVLSRNRAEAVVRALTDAGAPANRLTSAGYGDMKPIASNDAADGRARNRRIEFVLK